MELIGPEYMAWLLIFGPGTHYPNFTRASGMNYGEINDLLLFTESCGRELTRDIHKALLGGVLENLSRGSISKWLESKVGRKWKDKIYPFELIPTDMTVGPKDAAKMVYRECEESNKRWKALEQALPWRAKRDLVLRRDYLRCLRENPELSDREWARDVRGNRKYLAQKSERLPGLLSESQLRAIVAPSKASLMEDWPVQFPSAKGGSSATPEGK